MDVKDAVKAAKAWFVDLMSDEDIFNLGIDEVEFDEMQGVWRITLGFSRPFRSSALAGLTPSTQLKRYFRVIILEDSTGRVKSMKRRLADPD